MMKVWMMMYVNSLLLLVLQESLIKLQQVDHRLIQQQSLEERTGFRIFLCLNDDDNYYNYDRHDACSES